MKNEPIYPFEPSDNAKHLMGDFRPHKGLTKFEHYVGLAMQGIRANPVDMEHIRNGRNSNFTPDQAVADKAIMQAITLIEQLEFYKKEFEHESADT